MPVRVIWKAHDRLLSGIPVFTTLPLASWQELLKWRLDGCCPPSGNVPAIAAISSITVAYRNGSLQLVCLAEDYLDGQFQTL